MCVRVAVVLDILNRVNDFEEIIRDIADEVEEELNSVCMLVLCLHI